MNSVRKIPMPVLLTLGFAFALFIRLLLVPNAGFEADVAFWKSWGLAVMDFGLVKGLPLTNFNYPTPFGYFLFFMVKIYSLFADPHNFNQFWQNNNLLFLFISKAPAIAADFGIAGIFMYIGRNAKKLGFPTLPPTIYYLFSTIYLLNPVSLIDGAWWGQLDSLGVFLFLLALLFLLRRKSFISGIIFMISMMTKLQNMIYGPIFFLLMWEIEGWDGLVKGLAGASLTFAATNIEFIISRNFARVMESITGNYNYFPWPSLNAFNPWWIWTGARGMLSSDKTLALGLLSAKSLGLYVFSGGYLLAILRMFPWRMADFGRTKLKNFRGATSELRAQENFSASPDLIQHFFEAFIIVNGSFFLFQTESHDRYAFPLIVFLLLWAVFAIRRRLTQKETLQVFTTKPFKLFSVVYLLFTILYFYNLHTALVFNYPKNGIPALTALAVPWITIAVSYIFTGGFLLFLFWVVRDMLWIFIPPILLISLMVFVKNLPLITKTPVYVEYLTPTIATQGFGSREVDMPVNASLDVKNWSSLSVQYAFYRHGIGTHANSTEVYDIGGLFKTFTFDYGIDTEAGTKGSVTFEVWGDNNKLFASKEIGRFDMPRHAEVNIAGVHMLKLVVTDAGDGITDDHADWLNPKLTP